MSEPRPRFNKFEWLKALRSDPVITGTSAFHIGVDLCTTFTWSDGVGWAFQLAKLPPVAGKPLTRNTINAAVRLLVERGFIAVTYRSAGGRGVVAAISVDLIPVRSNVPVSTDTGATDDAGLPETGTIQRENLHISKSKPAQLTAQTSPLERTKNVPERCERPSQGISSGISSGASWGSARDASPTPEPQPPVHDPPEAKREPPEPFQGASAAATVAPPTSDGFDWFDYPEDDADGAPATEYATEPPEVIDAEVVDGVSNCEPQRYCDRHSPDGTDDPCGACKNRRLVHEAWERRQSAPRSGQAAKVSGSLGLGGGGSRDPSPACPVPERRCPWCDDGGIVLMSNGAPGNILYTCNHDGSRREATPQEIAEFDRRRECA